MIKNFKHKGLEKFFKTRNSSGIKTVHKNKINERLTALHTSSSIEDMNIQGWNLHPLKGDRKEQWSIKIDGNWRITFEYNNGNAYVVNYEDYH